VKRAATATVPSYPMAVLRAAVRAARAGRELPKRGPSDAAWEVLYQHLERARVKEDDVIGEAIRLVSLAVRAQETFLETGDPGGWPLI
jgi:hypothetical protein